MEKISFYKDENLSFVFNYQIIQLNEDNRNTGAMIRVLELYKFFQLKDKITKFQELTGFEFKNIIPDVKEIKLIIKKMEIVYSQYLTACEGAQSILSSAEQQLESLQDGRITKPANYRTSREWAASLYNAMERAQGNLKNEKNKFQKFSGLYGLLFPVIKHLIDNKVAGFKPDLLSHIPNEGIYLNALTSSMSWDYEKECSFIIELISELEKHIDIVTNNCSLPKDKRVLRDTPIYKIEYYKNYYQSGNTDIQQTLSADEYVNTLVNAHTRTQDKLALM